MCVCSNIIIILLDLLLRFDNCNNVIIINLYTCNVLSISVGILLKKQGGGCKVIIQKAWAWVIVENLFGGYHAPSTFKNLKNPLGFLKKSCKWLICSSLPNYTYMAVKSSLSSYSLVSVCYFDIELVLILNMNEILTVKQQSISY